MVVSEAIKQKKQTTKIFHMKINVQKTQAKARNPQALEA